MAYIEDLAKLGKRDGLCPYYSMRYQAENADLVLLPYNYLLDPASRRGLNVGGGICELCSTASFHSFTVDN